jgi:CheY-like chemotaxis protein
VASAVRCLALSAHQKELELLCDIAPDVTPWVAGDPTRLRQVLINLVGNAVKFTQRGEVGVRVRQTSSTGGRVNLSFKVFDTGIGIEAGKLNLIFESFAQADGTTTRQFGGTGLGLAISRSLVELMGGRLRVESTPGVGSLFSFELELEERPGIATEPANPATFQGKRCLVVDDNATSRRILEVQLQQWGLNVLLAESGEAALDLLDSEGGGGEKFDFLLVDLRMPGMDGFEFIGHYNERRPSHDSAILMLSSIDQALYAQKHDLFRIHRYLTKPIVTVDLKEEMQAALAGSPSSGTTTFTQPIPQPPQRALRVLLAEDNSINQKLATIILKKAGHEVVQAADGRVAVEAYKDSQEGRSIDLILMDLQMPVMGGFEATAEIRRIEAEQGRREVPIIALTASVMPETREECKRSLMNGYLSKPLSSTELLEAIDSFTATGWPSGTFKSVR